MRAALLRRLFEGTHGLYAATRTREPWGLSTEDLCAFPAGTFGRALGEHLRARGFALMPRLEDHDAMHLITGVDTDEVSEVELQFVLGGNGKRSLYLIGTLILGSMVFPEHLPRFVRAWARGAATPCLHTLDVRAMLDGPEQVGLAAGA